MQTVIKINGIKTQKRYLRLTIGFSCFQGHGGNMDTQPSVTDPQL